MGKYRICVYAISKNEEQFVQRWMKSVQSADQVVVLDTGSTDRTVDRLRDLGAVVEQASISPWRFDVARNRAMDLIPDDVDICVSNDLDEVFDADWREKLEAVWDDSCTRAQYLFTWSHRADGSPDKQFAMEKIHCRHGFRWVHPVHEVLAYSGSLPEKSVWMPGLTLHHYPDLNKPRTQYLPLLELSAQENPTDDRTIFWLGREYFYYQHYASCIQTLERHLTLPTAKWAEERSASMRFLAQAHQALGHFTAAKSWRWKAIAECPSVREPYLAMAQAAQQEHDWPLCYAMTQKALQITTPSGSYLVEPQNWGAFPYQLASTAAHHLGLATEAASLAAKAQALQGVSR